MNLEERSDAIAGHDHLADPIGLGWARPTIVVGGTPDHLLGLPTEPA